MATQSEQALENNLIKELVGLKYDYISIPDESALVTNLKFQLEKHNSTTFSAREFDSILNHLSRGTVFEKAQKLRDKMHLIRDDESHFYVEFFNQKQWCQNQYQVANQVTMTGSYKNRYDVTLLINGLPLVQIELKRRGLELKEAFNQTGRYHKHSYDSGRGLFQYVQIFVISNGVNTKYYANNKTQEFEFTSFWTDKNNKKITELSEFTFNFLERCHLSKMIAQYVVLTEKKFLRVLRPYQYYAVEAIVDRVLNSDKNGYIWHTTGSGKTLTSFKASQILVGLPDIEKVVFVVDRKDLDDQTAAEFNKYEEGSVDQTDSTHALVEQFGNPNKKLIVTTIQKLNNAVHNQRHLLRMDQHRDKKIVFVFDECHRSQFGETHKRITKFFTNKQLFGFTGTPIFAESANGMRTTKDLFGECLHKYVITDAINDGNVLRFSVEYVGEYKHNPNTVNDHDVNVTGINTKELLENEKRLEKIVDYIVSVHSKKTHNKEFNAIFATANIDTLLKYYDIFKHRYYPEHQKLKIATIFTYDANEGIKHPDEYSEYTPESNLKYKTNEYARDRLESCIQDYNQLFETNFTTRDTKSFYNYYKDIAKKVRSNQIDILLVVNMFLTGFDSPMTNTLYVDKNLQYHGLIQAYSRTNRIVSSKKSQGNIVAFRNLKEETDEAIALYSNPEAKEIIFLEPYEDYILKFNEAVKNLYEFVPTPKSVDELIGDEAKLEFIIRYRALSRIHNIIKTFAEFEYKDVLMNEQSLADYKSKYSDLFHKVKSDLDSDKASILKDVDFEIKLIGSDLIDVDYILKLLMQVVNATSEEKENLIKSIGNILSSEPELRSKKELIEKFINENIPTIKDSDLVTEEFDKYWSEERIIAFEKFCKDENLKLDKMQEIVDEYLFSNSKPNGEDLDKAFIEKPRAGERKPLIERIKFKFNEFISVFFDKV